MLSRISGSQSKLSQFMACECWVYLLGYEPCPCGHLTHGASVSFSAKNYNAVQFGLHLKPVKRYGQVEALAFEHKTQDVIAGFSAYSVSSNWQDFRVYR